MRILITGGAGFIGSHLADALIQRGHQVRILDSLETQAHGEARRRPVYLNPAAELIVANVLNREAVRRCLDGVEAVFHQAAVGTGRSTTLLDVARTLSTELGTANDLEFAGEFRAGDIRHCYADIQRIQRELGYAPRVPLEQGIKELLKWLRSQQAENHLDEAWHELEERGLARC